MSESSINRIFIMGNAAGGKTRLSRRLAELYKLPVTHVDSIQFLAGLKIRPLEETRQLLKQVESQDRWIIDGYGPLDLIEQRFKLADKIIFIDLPLWQHFYWLMKRQIKNLFSKRAELPPHCNEINWAHTMKIIKTMQGMNRQMRPELLKIFRRPDLKDKLLHVRSRRQWNYIYCKGLE